MASFGFGNLRLVGLPQVYLIQRMAITSIKAFELTNTTARDPYLAGLPVSSSGTLPGNSHRGICRST